MHIGGLHCGIQLWCAFHLFMEFFYSSYSVSLLFTGLFEALGDVMLYSDSCILQNRIWIAAVWRTTRLHSLNQTLLCNLYKGKYKNRIDQEKTMRETSSLHGWFCTFALHIQI